MYEDFEDIRQEGLLNLNKLVAPEEVKGQYRVEIHSITELVKKDKSSRESLARINDVAREQRFELMDLMGSRKKKLEDLISSPDPSTKMLVEDHLREGELKTSITILEDAASLVEKDLKEVGKKLLDVRKTASWLKNELLKQVEYKKAGRLENFERIF